MDKNELIARINSAREAVKTGADKSAMRILKTLAADLKVEDVFTTLSVDMGGLSELLAGTIPVTAHPGMSPTKEEEVDHFEAWVGSDEPRFGINRDFSVTKPGLHALYANWAHHHLLVINKAIKRLARFSNLNLMDTITALHKCRRDLILGDAAYRDAAARIVAGIEPDPYTEEHGHEYAAEVPPDPHASYNELHDTIRRIIADLDAGSRDIGQTLDDIRGTLDAGRS